MIQMNTILELFEAWAINFKSNSFLRTRLKLAFYYILGIVSLLCIFNVAVYSLFSTNFLDTPEEVEASHSLSQEQRLIKQAQDERSLNKLETILFVADFLIVILAVVLSYALVGGILKPIEDSYERQKKFIADVAHELRTPLTVMRTGIEVTIHSQPSLLEYKNLSDELYEEIEHLSALTDDLLFLAKNDAFGLLHQPEFEKINLSQLTEKHISQMQAYAKKKGIVFRADIESDCLVQGNVIHLKRLLSNLVQNAVEYNTPQGKVSVTLKKSNSLIILTVADTGIGIAKGEVAKIFDRFYKVDQSRVRKAGGAGLGLSIVAEIVRAHRGKIEVESQINAGTTFRVIFPTA